ncbi:peptide chain release factor N(5)-glutamine methyltransferase [Sediminibacterium ginsengisoli]|uniref:peptide chain release factor N(5)-glutamine methyltransferase n=1 Tax=Sediminibacterium ginsengisoli TaxID=413434 RepID=A0A1T4KXP6_9BACT|nr:peptide chain release factor N(5)-glutamine methyltransferase [Sediminibacterium ginsengisoli]SJZ47123.1 release factor glutamine methyltransferase [Sediminibacterium ginsengisoli]
MTISQANQLLLSTLNMSYPGNEASAIANLVMEELTGKTKAYRLLHSQDNLSESDQQRFKRYLAGLEKGSPVQYVLGEAWFGGLRFHVTEATLIPRPETEELVEEVIAYQTKIRKLLDIGTGSGCIPVTIKKRLPAVSVSAIDVSTPALAVAKSNAERHQADVNFMQFDFLREDTWTELGIFDAIVSNPPYVKESESVTMLHHVLNHEPHLALFVPDADPLLFYRKIALFGKSHLTPGGMLFLEINEALGRETQALLEEYGYTTTLKKDFYGKDRMILATLA